MPLPLEYAVAHRCADQPRTRYMRPLVTATAAVVGDSPAVPNVDAVRANGPVELLAAMIPMGSPTHRRADRPWGLRGRRAQLPLPVVDRGIQAGTACRGPRRSRSDCTVWSAIGLPQALA